ncbi:glycine zipper 2TM domain-containing protein [Undibacterium sp. RTI2.1]|uniref:glycine zipper 2TM domain-containing protein n=1 Tax=unclassified Undibacterium TaxID=2630295 RepID=UPI002AB5A234|nr:MULTISPECIES: glycine zipper 2TM domain-containing protein [unclassified Undibacterium]MDY7536846.1 glycine zipper 2TM domain-containing protein [Undibacterium sp. 5I1]MEB0029489.1 glycine zipper 2TM domain-containing protein [Undibacterium sp. RTI2.1]MEB0115675.1 glycine zipper 2TM domain-containing protein [Undibacterium sp. RTI2.2]MEB0232002.1 glycine zipper 2TM domain-containing protein [Undibacterium sp. 10I3]MEB0256728.1 glycine zipper 2TM domain-containing protein [Undibacterium sp. 
MKITKKIIASTLAISAFMPLLAPLLMLSGEVQAQQYNTSQMTPRIDGFNVDEVRRLAPGVELNFGIYGTPGGLATLRIAGATRNLTLIEVEAGQYEGTYTINSRDKIAARSAVTANLRVGNQVASSVLNESLQIGVGNHTNQIMSGAQPKIERFNVDPAVDLNGGSDLRFTVFGTPGGKVDLTINGVKGKIFLPEVASGEYVNSYTIRSRDRIAPNSTVTANLRVVDRGVERVTSATLGRNLQVAQVQTAPAPAARICYNCGTVEAVNIVEVKGEGSYLGTIGGGVVGALLGSQVGGGNGRTAAEIAGALGGAYAGRNIEGNARKTNHYEVIVRLQNGATQMIPFASEPGYRVGDKVQVNNGTIVRN